MTSAGAGQLEIASLVTVWVLAALWLRRETGPEGLRRHAEGLLTLAATLLWGLWVGVQFWHERFVVLALVLLPHTLMLLWALSVRRDGWAAGAALMMALGACVTGAGFRYVHTPSVPMGLYRAVHVDEGQPLSVGQTVCLDPHAGAAPNVIGDFVAVGEGGVIVKRVLATPGSGVDYDGQSLFIDGTEIAASHIWETSTSGKSLPQLAFPQFVDEGQVWLGSSHVRGFDSRYFGPASRRAITCIAKAVWLR